MNTSMNSNQKMNKNYKGALRVVSAGIMAGCFGLAFAISEPVQAQQSVPSGEGRVNPGRTGDAQTPPQQGINQMDNSQMNNSNDSRTNTNQSENLAPGQGGVYNQNNRTGQSGMDGSNTLNQDQRQIQTDGNTVDGNSPSTTVPSNRGNDRLTSPSSNQPGRGTYSSPRSQNQTVPGSTTSPSGNGSYGTQGGSYQNQNTTGTGGSTDGSTGAVQGLW